MQQPSPGGRVGQQDPDRLAHRAGQMGDSRVDGNNDIHEFNERRRFGEIDQVLADTQDVCKRPVKALLLE